MSFKIGRYERLGCFMTFDSHKSLIGFRESHCSERAVFINVNHKL